MSKFISVVYYKYFDMSKNPVVYHTLEIFDMSKNIFQPARGIHFEYFDMSKPAGITFA